MDLRAHLFFLVSLYFSETLSGQPPLCPLQSSSGSNPIDLSNPPFTFQEPDFNIHLHNKVISPQHDVTALNDKMSSLQGDIKSLKIDFTALNDRMSAVQGDNKNLKSDVTSLRSETRNDFNDVNKTHDQMHGYMKSIRGSFDQLHRDMKSLRGDIQWLRRGLQLTYEKYTAEWMSKHLSTLTGMQIPDSVFQHQVIKAPKGEILFMKKNGKPVHSIALDCYAVKPIHAVGEFKAIMTAEFEKSKEELLEKVELFVQKVQLLESRNGSRPYAFFCVAELDFELGGAILSILRPVNGTLVANIDRPNPIVLPSIDNRNGAPGASLAGEGEPMTGDIC